MNIFKKLDGIFFHSFVKRMEGQHHFLISLKDKNMSIDDGLIVLEQLITEERKCNILT